MQNTRRIGILILTNLAPLVEDKEYFKSIALRTIMGFYFEISYELRKVICKGCRPLYNGLVLNQCLSKMEEQEYSSPDSKIDISVS